MAAERFPNEASEALGLFEEARTLFFEWQLDRFDAAVHSWLAYLGGGAVGTATLTLGGTLPRLRDQCSSDGRIRNVFVHAAYRRRGIAGALVRVAIIEAEAAGVGRLTLGASSAGRPLYEMLGFVSKDDEMMYAPRNVLTAHVT